MTIKFITICPACHTAKLNEFAGMGESHATWLTDQVDGVQWTCHGCGFTGSMPVRDVEVAK